MSLAFGGCLMSPQMHLHGLDETTEERFKSLEERVSALEQGGPSIGPAIKQSNASSPGVPGRARAIPKTDYSE